MRQRLIPPIWIQTVDSAVVNLAVHKVEVVDVKTDSMKRFRWTHLVATFEFSHTTEVANVYFFNMKIRKTQKSVTLKRFQFDFL